MENNDENFARTYSKNSDEELIAFIREGDKEAEGFLLYKYKNLVKMKSQAYFLIGADRDDILQEGMIGLYKAIRDYSPLRGKFYPFAEICIERQVITAVKTATRRKHMPLNSYISLNKTVGGDGEGRSFIELIPDGFFSNPEDILINREDKVYIEKHIWAKLSDFESRTLLLYLRGKSYVEIAEEMGSNFKSVDNALQRIRRKVEKIIAGKSLTIDHDYAKI